MADFAGGTWMCQLGAVDDDRAVAQALLTAIGAVQHADASVVESIVRALGDRRTLILLDNCEHLLAPTAALSREILDRCPGVTLLATSREPLGLSVEQQYRLGELDHAAAIELFVAEARRHGASVDPADPAVARICRRLDDLPLAVQLAAARARSLDPTTIESLLDDRFAYLASSATDRPDHHQTLGAAIAWSFDALSPQLQQLLCDLSVLTGRFTLDEARAVAGGAATPTAAIVDGLDVLVNRSLVAGPERVAGESVYRLLESIRLFARDRGDRQPALERHLDYFCAAAEDNRRREQHDSLTALHWFRSRWSDLRQAQALAVSTGRVGDLCRIVNAVNQYCGDTGELEIVEWCARGLDPDPPTIDGPQHAEALANWASHAVRRGDVDLARTLVDHAASVAPTHIHVLRASALISWSAGDHGDTARTVEALLDRADLGPALEAGLLMFRAILVSGVGGDVAAIAHRLEALVPGRGPVFDARAAFVRALVVASTDPAAAVARLDECQFLTDRHDLVDIGAAVRLVRGSVASDLLAEPSEVLEVIGANVRWLQERGLWSYVHVQLGISAFRFVDVDRIDLAVTLLSCCQANGFATNFRSDATESLLAGAEEQHGDRYAEWWEAGQRLDSSAACALTLAGIEPLLTPR